MSSFSITFSVRYLKIVQNFKNLRKIISILGYHSFTEKQILHLQENDVVKLALLLHDNDCYLEDDSNGENLRRALRGNVKLNESRRCSESVISFANNSQRTFLFDYPLDFSKKNNIRIDTPKNQLSIDWQKIQNEFSGFVDDCLNDYLNKNKRYPNNQEIVQKFKEKYGNNTVNEYYDSIVSIYHGAISYFNNQY